MPTVQVHVFDDIPIPPGHVHPDGEVSPAPQEHGAFAGPGQAEGGPIVQEVDVGLVQHAVDDGPVGQGKVRRPVGRGHQLAPLVHIDEVAVLPVIAGQEGGDLPVGLGVMDGEAEMVHFAWGQLLSMT